MEKYLILLIRRCWVIILAAILAAGAAYIIHQRNAVQQYEATTSIYIEKYSIDSKGLPVVTYNDLLGAELVANDCKSIIPSRVLAAKVATELDMSLEAILNGLVVKSGGSARIVTISSTKAAPEVAGQITDSLARIFLEEYENYFTSVSLMRLDDGLVNSVGSKVYVYMAGAAFLGICFSSSCILLVSALRRARKPSRVIVSERG